MKTDELPPCATGRVHAEVVSDTVKETEKEAKRDIENEPVKDAVIMEKPPERPGLFGK